MSTHTTQEILNQLMDEAIKVVEHYHADVHWLDAYFLIRHQPKRFIWIASSCGTDIGFVDALPNLKWTRTILKHRATQPGAKTYTWDGDQLRQVTIAQAEHWVDQIASSPSFPQVWDTTNRAPNPNQHSAKAVAKLKTESVDKHGQRYEAKEFGVMLDVMSAFNCTMAYVRAPYALYRPEVYPVMEHPYITEDARRHISQWKPSDYRHEDPNNYYLIDGSNLRKMTQSKLLELIDKDRARHAVPPTKRTWTMPTTAMAAPLFA